MPFWAARFETATSLVPGGSNAVRCMPASPPVTASRSPISARIAFTERSAPLHIEHSHATDMSGEVSLADKVGQDCLIESCGKDIGGVSSGGECGDQVSGNDHVTHAQSRKHDFAEGPDIDNPRIRVEPLKRSNRTAAKAILAVVIVFDDPGAGANRPIEEKHTACSTHRHAHRDIGAMA